MSNVSSIVVRRRLATMRQVEDALARQGLYGGDLITNLLDVAPPPATDEDALVGALAEALGLPPADSAALRAPTNEAAARLSYDLADTFGLAPLGVVDGALTVATAEPLDAADRATIEESVGMPLRLVASPLVRIRQAIALAYGRLPDTRMARLLSALDGTAKPKTPEPSRAIPTLPDDPLAPLRRASTGRPISNRPPPFAPEAGPPPSSQSPAAPSVAAVARPSAPAVVVSPPPVSVGPFARATEPSPPSVQPPPPEPAPASVAVPPPSTVRATPAAIGALAAMVRDAKTAAKRSLTPARVRRRGPFSREDAEREIAEADSAPIVLGSLLDFTQQFLGYVALFLVREDVAEGVDARGDGADAEKLKKMGVPLDMPSLFATARTHGTPLVRPRPKDGLDAVVASDLGRRGAGDVVVLPVVVGKRVVALLFGDDGESKLSAEDLVDVFAVTAFAGVSLAQQARRRKGGPAVPAPAARAAKPVIEPHERARALLAAFGRTVARSEESTGASTKSEPAPTPAPPSAPAAAAESSPSPGPAAPTPISIPPTPPREPDQVGAAALRIASTAPIVAPLLSPTDAAPTTSSSPLGTPPFVPLRPRKRTDPYGIDLRSVREAHSEPGDAPTPRLPTSEPIDRHVEDDLDMGLEPSTDHSRRVSEPPGELRHAVLRRGALSPSSSISTPNAPSASARADVSSHEPGAEIPLPLVSHRRPLAPPIPREEPDEPSSGRALEGTPTPSMGAPSEPEAIEVTEVADEDLDALLGLASNSPESERIEHRPPRAPPAPRASRNTDARLPKVIVAIDAEHQLLVARLLRGGPLAEAAREQLDALGVEAVPALMDRFPGPTRCDRTVAPNALPKPEEAGPLLSVLVDLGRLVLRDVAARLGDPSPETRFWAAYLLSDIGELEVAPELVPRLVDDDLAVRRAAAIAARSIAHRARRAVSVFVEPLVGVLLDPGAPASLRVRSAQALGELREDAAAEGLVLALEEGGEITRAATAALHLLAQTDPTERGETWASWLAKQHGRSRVEWLIDALMDENIAYREAAATELKSLSRAYFGYYADLPHAERVQAQARYRSWWEEIGRARFA